MPFQTINGIPMFYQDAGDGDTILFVHGLGENHRAWSSQVEFFSEEYRVICPDLRGHGQSGDNEKTITIKQFVDDLVCLLDLLHIDKVHVCGLSLGGLVGFEFYNSYPERIKTLIISNGFSSIPEPHRSRYLQQWLDMLDQLSMDEFGRMFALNCLAKQATPELFQQVGEMFGNNRLVPYRQSLIAVYSADYNYILPHIKTPTLVTTGELDKQAPVSFAQKLAQTIPKARLRVIQGAGHLSNTEKPKEFNVVVNDFLKENR